MQDFGKSAVSETADPRVRNDHDGRTTRGVIEQRSVPKPSFAIEDA
jgi:hypothetical protein